ncbi:MAG: hypothetical protein V1833_02470 [Elusimicrobiota bacterium]
MIMLRMNFTKKQRENLAKAFFNAANFVFAIIILGSFVAGELNIIRIFLGASFWIIFVIIGTIIDKGE